MTETSTGTNVLITDEMVETAAAAIWNRSAWRKFDGGPLWDGRLPSSIRHSVRSEACAALEAAAPQIAATALRDAADWLGDVARGQRETPYLCAGEDLISRLRARADQIEKEGL